MSLVLARVDDRLIHGQVVVGWARHTEADCIVVANDAVAADPMQRDLLPMAVPQEMEVGIYRVTDAARRLAEGQHGERRCIVLFAAPADALEFEQAYRGAGQSLGELNVGGLRLTPDRRQARKAIALSPRDIGCLLELRRMGVGVRFQMVPADTAESLETVLNDGASS